MAMMANEEYISLEPPCGGDLGLEDYGTRFMNMVLGTH